MGLSKKESLSPQEGKGLECSNSYNQSKDSRFLIQTKAVFRGFWTTPKSMLQVALETGIMRSNITWYVNDWLKSKSIQRVKTGIDPLTRRKVGFYSTNPIYWKGVENGC
ncbi:hypothetical protein LV84_00469 [Algoriphagus ratkowskyi]|uniref:Uncharacterized protein n=1 Tax=Algoriphagus ratkowskyi TaxID=57028 RepID=A0A2W7S037_9BACT|nr:hypothetical protein [Algoriphagus ratkowskyi]PZX60199.1 hypothetical protein LV84_00469 [Algoriphagus ratkowskyi]TXD78025.1 hypothetical protein ESW18_08220 [Algoriphagus ratkowskyi]